MGLSVALLGALRVASGDDVIRPGGPKERALLAALALHAGRTAPFSSLIDAVWGAERDAHPRLGGRRGPGQW